MQNIPIKESFPVSSEKSYSNKEWRQGYQSQYNEYEYWIDDVEGEIPSGLNGTFFRNGPWLIRC